MPIIKKCIRCRKPTRPDGTCQNPACVRYVPEQEQDPETTEETKDEGGE